MSNSSEVVSQNTLPSPSYTGLLQIAVEKGAEIEKLERLMDLQERFEAKEAKKSFFNALANFQSDLPVIAKNGYADYGQNKAKYEFAKIEDIASAIKPHLKLNGLSYRFEQHSTDGLITVVCIVSHQDGHQEKNHMSAMPDSSGGKNGIQQIASTVSYLRRYTLTGGLGVIVGGEDDDGHQFIPASNGSQSMKQATTYDHSSMMPKWKALISSGSKTANHVIANLAKKNIVLTEEEQNELIKAEPVNS